MGFDQRAARTGPEGVPVPGPVQIRRVSLETRTALLFLRVLSPSIHRYL